MIDQVRARSRAEGMAQLWQAGLPTDLLEATETGWRVQAPGGQVHEILWVSDTSVESHPPTWQARAERAVPPGEPFTDAAREALARSQVPLLRAAPLPPAERAGWRTRLLAEVVTGRPLLEGLAALSLTSELLPVVELESGCWQCIHIQAETPALLVVCLDGMQVRARALLQGEDALEQIAGLASWLHAHPQVAARERVRRVQDHLEASLEPLLMQARADASIFRPRAGDIEKVFRQPLHAPMARYVNELWGEGRCPQVRVDAAHTEVAVFTAPAGAIAVGLAPEFPVAAVRLAQKLLMPATTWACWRYRAPGAKLGTKFEGLVWVDDHWAWFPRAWHAIKYA